MLPKELPEVIAQKRVSPDTQCLQCNSLGPGDILFGVTDPSATGGVFVYRETKDSIRSR